jgi:hypothetical protein
MPLNQPRRLATVLATGLGVVLSAGLAVHPAQAAGVAPTASYALNYSSIFAGQAVTLTESALADEDTDVSLIVRTISWGDGETSYLLGAESSESHKYATAGNYSVSVEVSDALNETAGSFAGGSAVNVGAVTGSYKLNTTSVWQGIGVTQPVTLSLAGVPSNVTQVKVNWGDFSESKVARNSKPLTHRYPWTGSQAVTVQLINGAGESIERSVGTVNVKADYAAPSVKLKVPAKSNRVASWKSVTGTASDKGAGAYQVAVVLLQLRGKTSYYYNGKKWIKGKVAKAKPIFINVSSKGVWSLKVNGLKKGTLVVAYAGVDKVGNGSVGKAKVVKLTR